MSESEICASCLTSEHPIDVRGTRFTADGAPVQYLICHSCCTILRRFHFNDEENKIKGFWNQVWMNLSLDELVEEIEEDIEATACESEQDDPLARVA